MKTELNSTQRQIESYLTEMERLSVPVSDQRPQETDEGYLQRLAETMAAYCPTPPPKAGQAQRPVNAKATTYFAAVRVGYIQSGLTAVPELYETAEEAISNSMRPLEARAYPMTLLPESDLDALTNRIQRLESGIRVMLEHRHAQQERGVMIKRKDWDALRSLLDV